MSSKSKQKEVVERWVPKASKSELTKIANHNGEAIDEKPELKQLTKNASRLNNRIKAYLRSIGVDPRPKRMKLTVDFICEMVEETVKLKGATGK